MEEDEENYAPILKIPETRLTLVEFPAIVKNVDKAMEMIGSASSIEKVVSGDSKYLELRYRPQDQNCHPLFGDNFQTNNLVIKVVKKNGQLNYEIVGIANNTIRFKGMSDFQYLQNEKVNEVENELNLPPPLFTRHDQPYDYKFRENVASKDTQITETDGSVKTLRTLKRPPKAYAQMSVQYEENYTPTEPHKDWKSKKSTKQLENVVKALFDVRPIWTMKALSSQFTKKQDLTKLKYVLPGIAYYMRTGPWRTTWLKLGLNPRTDVKYAKYQMLDFRVPNEIKEYFQPEKKKVPTQPIRSSSDLNTVDGFLHRSVAKTNSQFIFDSVPDRLQNFYQICDIALKSVQKLASKTLDACSSSSAGFYTKSTLDSMRRIMKEKTEAWVLSVEQINDSDIIEVERNYRALIKVVDTGTEEMVLEEDEQEEEDFLDDDENEDKMIEEDIE